VLEDSVKEALHKLSQDGTIRLKQFAQDDQAFGNTVVVISISNLDVKFVRDRDDVWCEILVPGPSAEWYFLEDMMNALLIPVSSTNIDLIGSLKATTSHIRQHLSEILQAFQAEHVVMTRQRVQEVVKQRVLKTYGFAPED
jgi:hypothetical protein